MGIRYIYIVYNHHELYLFSYHEPSWNLMYVHQLGDFVSASGTTAWPTAKEAPQNSLSPPPTSAQRPQPGESRQERSGMGQKF